MGLARQVTAYLPCWLSRYVLSLVILLLFHWQGAPITLCQELRDPKELVGLLGDERYSVREKASELLISLGPVALPAVQEGTRAVDREIRYRCERILAVIRKSDFQRRLAAFAADPTGENDYGLPGWKTFRAEVGSSETARRFFVDMVRAEPTLFEALALGPKAVAEEMEARTWQLQQQPLALNGQPLPLGSLASLLFMLAQDQVQVSDATATFILNQCFQGHFDAAIQEGANRQLLKHLLGKVISQAEDWPAYTAIRLALRYDMPEGLRPAERVLQGGPNASVVYIRQFALLAIGRFGNKSHTALLESLLDDPTPCIPVQVANKQAYETQLRDVALAVLWRLHGEDPRQHGFGSRVQDDPQLGLHPSTLGFASNEEREAALQEWRRFRSEQRSPAADSGTPSRP